LRRPRTNCSGTECKDIRVLEKDLQPDRPARQIFERPLAPGDPVRDAVPPERRAIRIIKPGDHLATFVADPDLELAPAGVGVDLESSTRPANRSGNNDSAVFGAAH